MTWYYESFKVVPHGWADWHRDYPQVELRWILRVVPVGNNKWKIVAGQYSALSWTFLDEQYLKERFHSWEAAVSRAHDLVSTVAVGGFGSRALTWPEAKAKVEAEHEAVLF